MPVSMTFRERTGQSTNDYSSHYLGLHERSKKKRNSHMCFLVAIFPIIALCFGLAAFHVAQNIDQALDDNPDNPIKVIAEALQDPATIPESQHHVPMLASPTASMPTPASSIPRFSTTSTPRSINNQYRNLTDGLSFAKHEWCSDYLEWCPWQNPDTYDCVYNFCQDGGFEWGPCVDYDDHADPLTRCCTLQPKESTVGICIQDFLDDYTATGVAATALQTATSNSMQYYSTNVTTHTYTPEADPARPSKTLPHIATTQSLVLTMPPPSTATVSRNNAQTNNAARQLVAPLAFPALARRPVPWTSTITTTRYLVSVSTPLPMSAVPFSQDDYLHPTVAVITAAPITTTYSTITATETVFTSLIRDESWSPRDEKSDCIRLKAGFGYFWATTLVPLWHRTIQTPICLVIILPILLIGTYLGPLIWVLRDRDPSIPWNEVSSPSQIWMLVGLGVLLVSLIVWIFWAQSCLKKRRRRGQVIVVVPGTVNDIVGHELQNLPHANQLSDVERESATGIPSASRVEGLSDADGNRMPRAASTVILGHEPQNMPNAHQAQEVERQPLTRTSSAPRVEDIPDEDEDQMPQVPRACLSQLGDDV